MDIIEFVVLVCAFLGALSVLALVGLATAESVYHSRGMHNKVILTVEWSKACIKFILALVALGILVCIAAKYFNPEAIPFSFHGLYMFLGVMLGVSGLTIFSCNFKIKYHREQIHTAAAREQLPDPGD